MHPNQISGEIIDAAMKVHTYLGPGLLESAYHASLRYELQKRSLQAQSQVGLPLTYEQARLDVGHRIDFLAENQVVVEVKAIDAIAPIHKAQLLSYPRLSERKLGLLINFNVLRLRKGIVRMVDKL